MRLFVDASAWVPMQIRSDQWRPDVVRLLWSIRQDRLEMVTTNWTLYEALSIARRTAHSHGRELLERARSTALIVPVDDVTERRSLQNFLTWTDRKASVVDHANTLTAVQNACDAILSFDRDFLPLAAAAGLRILR